METHITDVFARETPDPSDICLGERISLGKCVWGHTFPGGTHITVTLVEAIHIVTYIQDSSLTADL